MLLILEDYSSDFTAALAALAEKRGLAPFILSSFDIAWRTKVFFRLNDNTEELLLESGGHLIRGNALAGCLCLIHTFSPALWPGFTEQDADYAAAESHAMWLSILHSLKSKVVNPPAPDSLSGTALSSTELFSMASRLGLVVPGVIYTESSEGVNELLLKGNALLVSDLGEVPVKTRFICSGSGESPASSDNCHLVLEASSGQQYCICIAGERVFVSTEYGNAKLVPDRESSVPAQVSNSLRNLAAEMNINLCEFLLVRSSPDEWVIQRVSRIPVSTWFAYGEILLQAILNLLPGKDHRKGN